MNDQPRKDGFERMLEIVYRDLTALQEIYDVLLNTIANRPRQNNDDLLAAAKLIAGEIAVLQIKEREIRYMQDHPHSIPKPLRNART